MFFECDILKICMYHCVMMGSIIYGTLFSVIVFKTSTNILLFFHDEAVSNIVPKKKKNQD